MTHDDDFSRDLLARADAVAPAIAVDTTRVISNARRRVSILASAASSRNHARRPSSCSASPGSACSQ